MSSIALLILPCLYVVSCCIALLSSGDIILYSSHLVLFKTGIDLTFYVVAPEYENELMLQNVLLAFHDAVSMLLRHQVEKRSVLENLDLVVLALDETVDDGYVSICLSTLVKRTNGIVHWSESFSKQTLQLSHPVARVPGQTPH